MSVSFFFYAVTESFYIFVLITIWIAITCTANSVNNRFKVTDQEMLRSELVAWACLRLDRLRSGYRFIHLYDADGLPCDGVILVKVDKVFRITDEGLTAQNQATASCKVPSITKS